ncbi:hypothetical protein HYW36_02810 [Candidatus Saccharibacteria bacterium]|nr:hypothetical protein [Candidatus Saccharibacteria bacterium]
MHQKLSIKNYIKDQPNNGKFYCIAIDGRGGSGKTVFAEYLKKLLPDFVFLNGDDYFEPVDNQVVWGAFNDKRFRQDVIEPLKHGNAFVFRSYDWHKKPHITEQQITVTKGFCLERCFSLDFDLNWDLKIWVEAPKEVCLERGLARENMPRDRVLKAWQIWQSAEDKFIARVKPQEIADIVIDGTKPFENQLL